MKQPEPKNSEKGFTLIELVIAMTIIAIALIGTILAINTSVRTSADPMLTFQAIGIAESYLSEISGKSFPTSVPCPASPAANRATYTSVCDYNNLVQAPTDQLGNAMPNLSGYSVSVTIDTAAAVLGSPSLTSGSQVVRIVVVVTHNNMFPITLSTYRTSY